MSKIGSVLPVALVLGMSTVPAFAQEGHSDTRSHKVVAAGGDIEMSGVVEVELGIGDEIAGAGNVNDVSDIALATVELGFDAQINERVSGHILFLYEDGDDAPAIDEGAITINLNNDGSLNLSAGRMYIPFGNFETNLVSDPLTLALGESQEDALLLNFENEGVYGSAYLFNGDSIETSTAAAGDDTIEHLGFNVGYGVEGDLSYDLGVSYISSIADTDLISETIDFSANSIDSYVSGLALHATVMTGSWTVIGEYVASDQFKLGELDFNGAGAEPTAMNLELGYAIDNSMIAFAYQSTEEAVGLELHETVIAVAYSMEISEGTALSFELATFEDYAVADGGTGENGSMITIQLAAGF